MTDPLPGHSYHGNIAKDWSRNHYGDVHGDVYHGDIYHGDVYVTERDRKQLILKSLRFDGMDKYHERPLESYEGTYEWVFDEDRAIHSCETCAGFSTTEDLEVEIDRLSGDTHYELRQTLRDCKDKREFDTFRDYESQKFRSWLRTSQDIFWIGGKAGAGKSCLMKFLLGHHSTRDILCKWAGMDVTLAGFFFWAAGGQLEKSQVGLLRSLLYQVLQQQPELIPGCLPHRWSSHANVPDFQSPWTDRELRDALGMASQSTGTNNSLKLCLFVDGLDEFDGDHQDLIQILDTLNTSPNVKLCVASRPWNVFLTRYGQPKNEWQWRLQDLNKLDITTYIRGRFEDSDDFQDMKARDRKAIDLVDQIREKAEGVFLWVNLTMRELRLALQDGATLAEMLQILEEIPAELDDQIQRIFDSIRQSRYSQSAARVFLMLLAHDHYLPLLWLAYVEGHRHSVQHDSAKGLSVASYQVMVEDAAKAARRWCKDLLDIGRADVAPYDESGMIANDYFHPARCEDLVRFSHRTIYDFIDARRADGTLSELAGQDFCPSFTLCWIRVQLMKLLNVGTWQVSSIVRDFFSQSGNVSTDKSSALVELSLELKAVGNSLGCWADYWMIDAVSTQADMHPTASIDDTIWFMASMANQGSERLFWLLYNATPVCRTRQAKSLLVESCYHDFSYLCEGPHLDPFCKLMDEDFDPNEPITRRDDSVISVWQRFLLVLHHVPPHLQWDAALKVLDVFLRYGADPAASLETDKLYSFLKRISRLKEVSSRPGMISACEAFEVPGPGAEYEYASERKTIETYFPIIKAKLEAAVQAREAGRLASKPPRRVDNEDQAVAGALSADSGKQRISFRKKVSNLVKRSGKKSAME